MHIKKDNNHNVIENLFRACGWVTIDTSTCHGVLLDFIAYKRRNEEIQLFFVEVKNGNKPLTPNEIVFIRLHSEYSLILKSEKQAREWLGIK